MSSKLQAPTEEQMHAMEALKACPLSVNKFCELCFYILESDPDLEAPLKATLQFLRDHKLPKAKTVDWLSAFGVTSDYEVIVRLHIPNKARTEQYLADHQN